MRIVIGIAVATILAFLALFGWFFQPWMQAGRAVQIRTEDVGVHRFQVWQRKNDGVTEPFATGLFVRGKDGKWLAFLLDFQDIYRSPINFRMESSGIGVFRSAKKLGVFDETQETFKRASDGTVFEGYPLDGAPPGNWWLDPAKVNR